MERLEGDVMCVFICANPTVHAWLEVTVDHAARESFQLCPVYPCGTSGAGEAEFAEEAMANVPVPLAPQRVILLEARPWKQVRFRQLESRRPMVPRGRLAPLRHNPLESFTQAWSRLLRWLGWCR